MENYTQKEKVKNMFVFKNGMKRVLALIMVSVMMLALLCACNTQKTDTLDYSKSENWAYNAVGDGKNADLFLICPTVDMGKNGNYNMSMDDTDTKESFVGALNMEKGIYEDSTTMYAPYYRQMTFPVYSMTEEEILSLPMGAYLMTLETGIRFLGDYLNGDVYFQTHRNKHNLERARTQLKLALDMETKLDAMAEIVKKYAK